LKRLYSTVLVEHKTLKLVIDSHPESNHDHGKRKNNEYEQAYRLLWVQVNNMLEGWSQPIESMTINRSPNENEVKYWIDYQYFLEDSIEDFFRFTENMFRQRILDCLEVIDTIDRLQRIGLPEGEKEENPVGYLVSALNTAKAIRIKLLIALHRRGIWEIPLSKGDYPPVESTHIIAKEGSEENSRYVITEVVNDGYTYKKSILRRASVIVTTQSEEMEKWAE